MCFNMDRIVRKGYTVVPLVRDHKESPQKLSLKRGLPYLVGNQEVL